MAYIATHREHHQAVGELPPLPAHWYTYGAWRLLAELARRQPGLMHVVEGEYPAGGTVWFLVERQTEPTTEIVGSPTLARLNETGHVDTSHPHEKGRCPIEEDLVERDDPRLWTVESIFSPRLREMVTDVEGCFGMTAPPETPSTVASTIGWRVIASALGVTLHTQQPLTVSGLVYDGVSPQAHLLESFSTLRHLRDGIVTPDSYWSNAEIEPVARGQMAALFALRDAFSPHTQTEEPHEPLLFVDIVQGVAHFRSSTVDLMKEFVAHNRNSDAVAWELIQRARAERG